MQEARPHERAAGFWRPILHRWFVEYNPLYLLSAALVLAGTILVSRGLAEQESAYGSLAVTAISELYSVILIGGAALLMRAEQRRSALMLAMLAMVYQCDVTLHTSSCPGLGWAGWLATGAWFALFGAKLWGLSWAMKLRFSRALVATMMTGALGLALLPYCLQSIPPRAASALVMGWLFALATLQRLAWVTREAKLDDWGQTVLRRAVGVTWALFVPLLSLHVYFWSVQGHLDLVYLAPVLPLILTRWIRSDQWVYAAAGATLLITARVAPAAFAATALVAAAAFCLRAWQAWQSGELTAAHAALGSQPYRAEGERELSAAEVCLAASMRASLIGASVSLYLALWTLGWSGGPWPAHLLPLDLLVTAVALVSVWIGRAPVGIIPLAAAWVHFVYQCQIISVPRSTLQWGTASITLGFSLLVLSLAVSYWLKAKAPPETARDEGYGGGSQALYCMDRLRRRSAAVRKH